MKKSLIVSAAALLLCVVVWVQEYTPENPVTKSTVQETETTTGYRTVVETSVPVGSPSSSVVTKITSYRIVSVKRFENGMLMSQQNNQIRDERNSYPWFFGRTNVSGDTLPIPIKDDSAIVWWRGWKNSQQASIPE